jgi:hypothetical protein
MPRLESRCRVEDASEYDLVMAFVDPSPEFAHGFECGMLWHQMRDKVAEITTIVHAVNHEQLMRMAEVWGYDVAWPSTDEDGWEEVVFSLQKKPKHFSGLRIIR